MATRRLATRMWSPAASAALRQRASPGMPPLARSQFVDTIHNQNGHATRKFSSDNAERARATLERAKKQEVATRNLKRYSRALKFMKWTLNLSISAAAGALVVGRPTRV